MQAQPFQFQLPPTVVINVQSIHGLGYIFNVFGDTVLGVTTYPPGDCSPHFDKEMLLAGLRGSMSDAVDRGCGSAELKKMFGCDDPEAAELPVNFDVHMSNGHTFYGCIGNYQNFLGSIQHGNQQALERMQQQMQNGLIIAQPGSIVK